MTLEEVASRLDKARRKTVLGCPGYQSCCPAHEDKNPSFAVWEGADGWLHVKCQRGCSEAEILSALGLRDEDRRIQEPIPLATGAETVYVYTDAHGQYLFEKYRPANRAPGKPKCLQRIRQAGGGYLNTLASLNGKSKTLYHLGEVLAAVRDGRRVWINEGEKAVEMFRRHGEVATCQPAGAGPGKWLDHYTAIFRGAEVIIVADRDAEGEAYAGEVACSLLEVAKSVRVVQSKTTREKDDAYDHFAAEGTVDDFVPRPDLIKLDISGLERFESEEFQEDSVEFVWEPYLHLGAGIMFAGDSGTGKSSLMIAIMAGLSVGQLPNGDGPCEPVRSIYFIGDADGPRTYETIYRANGGKPGAVTWVKGLRPLDERFRKEVRHLVRMHGAKIVVLDPLFNFMALAKTLHASADGNNAFDAVGPMGVCCDLAEELGVCFVIIHHAGKASERKASTDNYLGSAMLKARARGFLLVRRHPEERGVWIVTHEKGSALVREGDAFAYRRVDKRVEYIQGMENPFDGKQRAAPGPAPEKLAKVKDALYRILKHGPLPFRDARERAMAASGASQRLVYDAAKSMGINLGRGIPNWELPTGFDPFADDEQPYWAGLGGE